MLKHVLTTLMLSNDSIRAMPSFDGNLSHCNQVGLGEDKPDKCCWVKILVPDLLGPKSKNFNVKYCVTANTAEVGTWKSFKE